MTKEAALQATVIKWLKARGAYVIKTGGLGTPDGCPDVVALLDGGGWLALEIKASKTAKFQPLQKITIEKLDKMYYSRVIYQTNWKDIKKEIETII